MIEPVKLIECPRDAWQGLPRQIPLERKVEYLRALLAAGFRHIDAVSFVSPKAVPQMRDSEQVLEQLGPVNNVDIIGIVVNERGAERAIATGRVSTLGYPCSISETFLRRNQNQTPKENEAVLSSIKNLADKENLGMIVYVSMGFGNPYGDPWSEDRIAEAARAITGAGVNSVSIADTIGAADPELVHRVVTAVLRECSESDVGVHLHSTRARTGAKILAAYDAGCRRFDAAMSGLGGCPFAQDQLVGNVATEEVLRALQRRGHKFELADHLSEVAVLTEAIRQDYEEHRHN